MIGRTDSEFSGMDLSCEDLIGNALATLEEKNYESSDGRWLEELTSEVAPCIADWDVRECWSWAEWPQRQQYVPGSSDADLGIDRVAVRRSDGGLIAIQCKARKLNLDGAGAPIRHEDLGTFLSESSGDHWVERWVVTNGNNPLSPNVDESVMRSQRNMPVKHVNIHADLRIQAEAETQKNPAGGGRVPALPRRKGATHAYMHAARGGGKKCSTIARARRIGLGRAASR